MPKQVVELKIGMLGWSAEAIAATEDGFCHFPVGEVDPTYHGGRKWIKIRVTALEIIRAQRDVIVADEELNVKEHTPVELSYERAAGGFQRVTQTFPLPNIIYFEDETGNAQVVTSRGEPLPVSMGYPYNRVTAPPVIATAAPTTQIIAAPGAGLKLVVHYISYSNAHAVPVDVALTHDNVGAAANLRHRHTLAATGGNINANLTDCVYELPVNTALFAWLAAAYAGGVVFNIVYSIEPVAL